MSLNVAVTGANGYTGRFVAGELLRQGHAVRNLTAHPNRPSGLPRMSVHPLDFADAGSLDKALAGADALVNTYWVRLPPDGHTYDEAVRNTERLATAARRAGVRRIVHVSVARAGDSELPYYRGKARAEDAVRASGVPAAIVRPAVLFGGGDVLINNIAWVLRHLPVFGVPGDGRYPVQPVHVEDHAVLIAGLVVNDDDGIHDSLGPERYTFEELVRMVRWGIGSHALVLRMPPLLAQLGASGMGLLLRDALMTPSELDALMDGLLATDAAPTGTTSLAQWLRSERGEVGRHYASDAKRHVPSTAAS